MHICMHRIAFSHSHWKLFRAGTTHGLLESFIPSAACWHFTCSNWKVQDLKKTLVSPGWVGNQMYLQKIQYFIVNIYVYSMNSIQTKYQYIEMAQLPHAITTLGSWLVNTAGSTCKRLGLLLSRPFGKWWAGVLVSYKISTSNLLFNLTKNAR